MPYEPGSTQCLGLIAAKDSILSAMNSLSRIENVDHIQEALKALYTELEKLHDARKVIEKEL